MSIASSSKAVIIPHLCARDKVISFIIVIDCAMCTWGVCSIVHVTNVFEE